MVCKVSLLDRQGGSISFIYICIVLEIVILHH